MCQIIVLLFFPCGIHQSFVPLHCESEKTMSEEWKTPFEQTAPTLKGNHLHQSPNTQHPNSYTTP